MKRTYTRSLAWVVCVLLAVAIALPAAAKEKEKKKRRGRRNAKPLPVAIDAGAALYIKGFSVEDTEFTGPDAADEESIAKLKKLVPQVLSDSTMEHFKSRDIKVTKFAKGPEDKTDADALKKLPADAIVIDGDIKFVKTGAGRKGKFINVETRAKLYKAGEPSAILCEFDAKRKGPSGVGRIGARRYGTDLEGRINQAVAMSAFIIVNRVEASMPAEEEE